MRRTPALVGRGRTPFRPGLHLRRDPRLWWAAVACCALLTGWTVAGAIGRAERSRVAWGPAERVLVASRDLAVGEQISPGDVQLASRPRAMVPGSALRELPPEATVSDPILAGEVVVRERIAGERLSPLAAALEPGTRAIAIPTEPGSAPPLTPGDHVDVLVALAPGDEGAGPPGFVVAIGVVLSVDDSAVTVAVARDAAPRIAVALGHGAVTLALAGAGAAEGAG